MLGLAFSSHPHLQPIHTMRAFSLVRDLLACLFISQTLLFGADGDVKPQEGTHVLRPNVIVILADDLGWADLSCYGSTFHETPNLDRLAKQGMRFTQGYAAHSYCSPTRAALLTGCNPARLKITDYIPSNGKSGKHQPAEIHKELPLAKVTLAEIVGEHGYFTWHVGKWHLGDVGFYPQQQGFEINIAGHAAGLPLSFFWPYGNPNDEEVPQPKKAGNYHSRGVPGVVKGGKEGEHLCDRLTDEAIKLIKARAAAEPFFLHLTYYDVHTPIQAKPELIAKYTAKAKSLGLPAPKKAPSVPEGDPAHGSEKRDHLLNQCNATYAAMVETLDTNVGKLLEALNQLDIANNTLVIFTSDNGGLNQHNLGATPITSNSPLRAGKGWLYEGGVRVPWIVRWPGKTKPGSVCDLPIITSDLAPTVLEICDLPPKPDLHLDGKSFASLLQGANQPIHESLFWHFPHYGNTGSGPCSSVRVGDWKLIHWIEDDSVELFDLATDPGEKLNLAAQDLERSKDLRSRLDTWREKTHAIMPKLKP